MTLDWRAMFWKYTEVVGDQEGVDFVDRGQWTDEEWAAIRALFREKGEADPNERFR